MGDHSLIKENWCSAIIGAVVLLIPTDRERLLLIPTDRERLVFARDIGPMLEEVP